MKSENDEDEEEEEEDEIADYNGGEIKENGDSEEPKPKTRPREQSFNGPLPEEPPRDDIAFLSSIEKPPALARNTSLDSSASSYSEVDARELFSLPNESTHAYSYNPLSPNSLAVRLTILKRSLEIIIGHPDMLRDDELDMNENTDIPVQRRKSLNNLYPRFESFSADRSAMRVTSQKWQPHRATLNAFVANSTTNFRNLISESNSIGSRSGKSGNNISATPGFPNINVGGIKGIHRAASVAFLPSTFSKLSSEKSLRDINNKYGRRPNPSVTFREPFKDVPVPESKGEDDTSSSTNTLSQEATKGDHIHNNAGSNGDISEGDTIVNDIDQFIDEQRANLMSLLDLLNETLENNTSAKASDLHMISLFNLDKLSLKNDSKGGSNSESERRTIALKKTLLDSLAEPFFEHYNETNNNEDDPEFNEEMEDIGGVDDSVSLSELRPQQDYGRILRTFTSTKNSAPQAIFTCSQQDPWKFKAANDLACLIFGISKNGLRALTLLDLIHTDSRNFVVNKLSSTEGQELVFTGEIIGIMQPGMDNSNLVWASFWAKRKNDMLVCVFEKVPCDYADVMLSLTDFSVTSVQDRCGLLESKKNEKETKEPTFHIGLHDESSDSEHEEETSHDNINITLESPEHVKKSVKFANEISKVAMFSKSLAQLIQDVCDGKLKDLDDDLLPLPLRVSNRINYTRYFTLSHLPHHVPCAVSSTILENEIKLKIHGIPYQAGLFVVDSHNFQMISFNKSIIKNMFGYHFADMVGKPITDIIPSFAELIKYTSLRYPALNVTNHKNRGLVLTEHFFRKLRAEMKGRRDEFYTSIGIDAIHRDGGMIKIDFQVRVMNSNVLLLWITHSRDVFFSDYTTTPSQLHMLKENDLAVVSSGGSSTCSSNKSSSHLSTGTLKALSKISDYREIKTDQSFRENSEKSSTTSSKDSTVFEKDNKPINGGGDDEVEVDDSEIEKDIDDPDLRRKLALAKIYHKDKSQFVKEENFKVNQSFILSKISIQPSTESLVSTRSVTSAPPNKESNLSKPTTFLTSNESPIGSKKHSKKFTDFIVLQKMGEGAYGKVNLCLHKKERYIVVIKMIFKERILVDTWVRDRKLGTIPSEIQIMATLSKEPQENILTLLDFFEDDDYYYIETPVHGETGSIDLFDLIEFKTNMTELEAKLLFKQVVLGLKYLHDQGIVHRDIKDENIIVDSQGFVKIIDFGSAAYVKSGPFDVFVGTIDYAAPEVLGGNPYAGKPQDIWAIGILLYTIVFKENPFYNIDEILEGELKFNNTEGVSEQCKDLISRILNKNVQKRPTIDDIYNDDWLILEYESS